MFKLNRVTIFYFFSLVYVLGGAWCLLFKRDMFIPFQLLPAVLLVVLLAVFSLETVMYLMVFSTPLAISLKEMGLSTGFDLSLPSEPLMIGIMLIYLLNELHKGITPKKILKHPITRLVFLQLAWMALTSMSSQMPLVSVKYLISRLWFVVSCYFMATQVFKNYNNIYKFILAYAIPLAIVCIITTVRHSAYGFDEKTADWIVSPFYNDHTAFGVVLAMFIPVMIGFVLMPGKDLSFRALCLGLLGIFVISIVLSYARAGWLSLMAAAGILATLFLRIKLRTLLISAIALLGLFFVFQSEILMVLGRNSTDSDGDFEANVESMTNISTDASNLERINRWNCALRMFKERPVLGWGPGTYQFQYAPFQKSGEITVISTNFGDNGNAHSEYLGPLSEQGVLGLLIVAALVLSLMFMGYRLYYNAPNRSARLMVCSVFLGLCTYFIHGFLNNFLDTDKASVPFWGFVAILVCMDVYYMEQKEKALEPASDKAATE